MNWVGKHSPVSVSVTESNMASMLADLTKYITANRGFSVATLNLDHVTKLKRDPEFARAYSEHTHITADGNPIVWLSRLSGNNSIQLIPGSDLIGPICALATQLDVSVGLLGSTEDSLELAASELQKQYSGLRIAFTYAPQMGFDPNGIEASQAISMIRKSQARIVVLALGAPKQERFAALAQTLLPEVGFLCTGAGLDFISGAQRRAPQWVRAICAEWVWRLVCSPRRLVPRYFNCFVLLPHLVMCATRIRWAREYKL